MPALFVEAYPLLMFDPKQTHTHSCSNEMSLMDPHPLLEKRRVFCSIFPQPKWWSYNHPLAKKRCTWKSHRKGYTLFYLIHIGFLFVGDFLRIEISLGKIHWSRISFWEGSAPGRSERCIPTNLACFAPQPIVGDHGKRSHEDYLDVPGS